MEKPNLEKMWDTFIKIEPQTSLQKIIRTKIYPLISGLTNKGIISWYFFLIHDRNSGVPTTKDDNNAYFHIRVSLRNTIEPKDFSESLPSDCIMTRKIERKWVESILGLDKSLMKNEEIEEAWKIMGEQSEWIINMLNIHRENVEVPIEQITQFMHYYLNMLGLGGQAILLLGPFFRF